MRLGGAIAGLSTVCIPELSCRVGRTEDRASAEASRLGSEVARLGNEISQVHDVFVQEGDRLDEEEQRLHSLATGRLEPQLKLLNRQLHDFKHCLYHPGLSVSPDAFNGQFSKHQIFSDLMEVFRFDALVETGANLGST